MPDAVNKFNEGMAASGYVMTVVKMFELVCGLMLLSGFKSQLATVIIFPITLNIVLFRAFLMPAGIVIGLFFLILNLILAYSYRSYYASLLNAGNTWKA